MRMYYHLTTHNQNLKMYEQSQKRFLRYDVDAIDQSPTDIYQGV